MCELKGDDAVEGTAVNLHGKHCMRKQSGQKAD